MTTHILNFLPGPVCIEEQVQKAFKAPCISHRGQHFMNLMQQTRQKLCEMTGASNVQIVLGSGTLANEIVAAQLSLFNIPGLILSNGEFGERLIACARNAQLKFECFQYAWGERLDLEIIGQALSRLPRGSWVWMAHHETSTGMLNPIEKLKTLCQQNHLHLCLDCISTLGAVPVDLSNVYLATGTSGKGLGSYPGLALVFHNHYPNPQPERLPSYLDLGHWARNQSVPYTHSSNLLSALAAAMTLATKERMQTIEHNMAWLRLELSKCGLLPLLSGHDACSAIVTLTAPESGLMTTLGQNLERHGCWTSYQSAYLLQRQWLQISLLGNPSRADLEKLRLLLLPIYAKLKRKQTLTS